MKIRRLLAAASAAAVCTAAVAVNAGAYEAFLMFADADWAPQSMDAAACPDGHADITADGTYTVFVNGMLVEDEETAEMVPWPAEGAVVFCVDIDGLAADKGAGKDAEGYEDCQTGADKMAFAKAAGIEVTDVSIQCTSTDGTVVDVPVDQSKVIFGDIEGNGKIRIELYNEYGDTKNDPPITNGDIKFDDKMAVTFTISGVGEAAAPDAAPDDTQAPADDTQAPAATTPDKGSPDTGVEGIAAIAGVAVLAAGAVLVSKKRK